MLRAAPLLASGLVLLVAGCGGSENTSPAPADPTASIASVTGAFALTTFPGDAQAQVRFADFVTDGTVAIENEGRRAGRFALHQEIDFEEPSGGAQRASADVALRIVDTTGEGSPRALYRGPVAGLDTVSVGQITAGSSREYAFEFTPRTPLRRSRLVLAYRWVRVAPETVQEPAAELGVRVMVPHEQRVLDTRRMVAIARCTRRCRIGSTAQLHAPARALIRLPVTVERVGPSAIRLELRAPQDAFSVIRSALTEGPPVAVTLRVGASGDEGGSAVATERIWLKPAGDD